MFLVVPMMVILVVLKIPVVRLILGTGAFDWTATIMTSWVLAVLSIGLIAQASNTLIIRTFFALNETKLPVLIGILAGITSVICAAALMGVWDVIGLAIGVTIGSYVEALLLFWLLDKRLGFDIKKLVQPFVYILLSGILMAGMIYIPVRFLDQEFLDTSRVVNLLILVWLVLTTGGTTYLAATWLLGVEQVTIFFKMMWKLRDFKEAVSTASTVHVATQPPLLED